MKQMQLLFSLFESSILLWHCLSSMQWVNALGIGFGNDFVDFGQVSKNDDRKRSSKLDGENMVYCIYKYYSKIKN